MDRNSEFNNEAFLKLINRLFAPLNSAINYAFSVDKKKDIINTSFLGRSNAAATRLEETLDYYNAKNNLVWRPFRNNIASVKLFTDVSYITLHLKSTSPHYQLLSGIDKFLADTDGILNRYSTYMYMLFSSLLENADAAGLKRNTVMVEGLYKAPDYPAGRLDSNFQKIQVDKPEQVIVSLATSYLNLESKSILLKNIRNIQSEDYNKVVPDLVSEDSIRLLECKFHNLQSLYDTYISNTDIEDLDSDLKLIRGHASIVFHLLEAASRIIHYYERHIKPLEKENREDPNVSITAYQLLDILINYYLNYSEQFLTAGKNLCKKVIKKYAEEGTINVKVPIYRGFHVRPSTLIAKIVQHYGSDVYLLIDGEKYDASSPMNLFRVNEKINAEKRRNLARNISKLKSITNFEYNKNFEKGLKEIFLELLEEKKIINYSTDFSLPDIEAIPEETLAEFANRAIANLLAQGKIDLKTDLIVSFHGDKRVLADIEVLADYGYGEDSYGNNIVLPEELSYIRR